MLKQCDLVQLNKIKKILSQYNVGSHTSRYSLKMNMISDINNLSKFSMNDIKICNGSCWKFVESKFFNSMCGRNRFKIKSIQIIRNEKLFNNFENKRKEYQQNNITNKTHFVYHGSSLKCLKSIAKKNFYEPKKLQTMNEPNRNKNGVEILDDGYFGKGIYHGFAADYAILYSAKYKKSDYIIMSKVLPGKIYEVKKGGSKYGASCQHGYQSHISPEKKELVLFKAAQILPMFIIQFEKRKTKEVTEEPLY